MTTIKSYTDLEQSKKLAKILPLESADYHYIVQGEKSYFYSYSLSSDAIKDYDEEIKYIPCWSLAALLGVLPSGYVIVKNYHSFYFVESRGHERSTNIFNSPIDACVAMIGKLYELNLL